MQQTLIFCVVVQQYPTMAVRILKRNEDSAIIIDDIGIGSISKRFLLVNVSVLDLCKPSLVPSIAEDKKDIVVYLLVFFEVNGTGFV